MEKLRQIIAQRLQALNIGAVEAATKVGLEKGYIRDFLSGRKKSFRNDKFAQLAQALELDIAELMEASTPEHATRMIAEKPNAKILGPVKLATNRKIPIYGQAVAGINGEFMLNGNILYEVLCPPQLADVQNAYGVVVSGDSMSPRYEDGEVVFLNPQRRVKQNDYVVAQIQMDEFSTPHAFVKRFVRHNAQELVLSQFNPPMELKFPHARVVSVHFIAVAGEV
ncbi:XRE family transcriptional regulator [Bartonella sp. HY329]|uniref:XRE family transcriptional regulator n=1 Tax=unclassified Bartonella TaxID=2645622 RepID=UPI0021C74BD4|nr:MULTISPECIES: S24 family peptidase [unclassified Bartonella]UXM96181.1 XRE family transcriptional regulator [Bartonella sp. HY329]UXN10505.1 XRE family transcriptional regulator [Bartonella sp. HY328]